MSNNSKKVFVSKKITQKKVLEKAPSKTKATTKASAKTTKKPVSKKSVTKKAPLKKTLTKKTPVKKTVKVSKATAKTKAKTTKTTKKTSKDLVYANNEQSFWLSDGQILNSLLALHEALQMMNDEVFFHHVGENKNDFAEWVDFVLCDGNCAVELRKADSKDKATKVVKKYLQTYKI